MSGVFEYLSAQALRSEHLHAKVEHLIEGFLPKQMISVWYADGGSGKSYLSYAVAKQVLDAGLRVVVLDPDNSLAVLKERAIDTLLIDRYEKLTYLHRSSMDAEVEELLAQLGTSAVGGAYRDTLFIFDSLKDIVLDLQNDTRIARVMKVLMNMREAGATILLLHHTNKDGKNYQGSNQIRNSADVMYRLHQKPSPADTINYFLEVKKERSGVVDRGYSLDTRSLDLTELDSMIAEMSSYEMNFVRGVKRALGGGDINQSELMKAIGTTRDDRTARATLDKFDGKFYRSEYRSTGRARAKFYFLDSTKTTETTETPPFRGFGGGK